MLSRQTGTANQNGLLLICHIDNSSIGDAASGGTLVPGSHKTCEWRTETMENTCITCTNVVQKLYFYSNLHN